VDSNSVEYQTLGDETNVTPSSIHNNENHYEHNQYINIIEDVIHNNILHILNRSDGGGGVNVSENDIQSIMSIMPMIFRTLSPYYDTPEVVDYDNTYENNLQLQEMAGGNVNIPLRNHATTYVELIDEIALNEIKDDMCVICLDSYSLSSNVYMNPVKTSCNHIYCKKCIQKWFEINSTCPVCKHNFNDDVTDVNIEKNI
jgi:hypothetical protein